MNLIVRRLIYFSSNVSYSSLPVFLPTVRPSRSTSLLPAFAHSLSCAQILSDMGYSSIRAQGLSAPPYLAAFIVILGVCYLGDRWGDRTILIIPLSLVGAVGYLILALVETTGVRYVPLFAPLDEPPLPCSSCADSRSRLSHAATLPSSSARRASSPSSASPCRSRHRCTRTTRSAAQASSC